ncbi:hypothetical protein [Yinghuangia seranimata]|uniref:hypothetical protein n=1 Tax=Yinghuangia seranimata TaxID=408067 RepID=UPI00248C201B|nr:hypothetical protein [Yinghuangia seranimata]MDI2128193.1 hypothetical protein [Yinghuangia seranimata]
MGGLEPTDGDGGSASTAAPAAAPLPAPAEESLGGCLLWLLVFAAAVALPWWSWDATHDRDHERIRVDTVSPARVPQQLCGGGVEPADVSVLVAMRAAKEVVVRAEHLPSADDRGFRCDIDGAYLLRVEVRPVADVDPATTMLDTDPTPGTVPGGYQAGLAAESAAWVAVSCPELGSDQGLFARAALVDGYGAPVNRLAGDFQDDERVELARLAAHALRNVAARAGCPSAAGAPDPVVPAEPPAFERKGLAPDAICGEVLPALPPVSATAAGSDAGKVWGPPGAGMQQCGLRRVFTYGKGWGSHVISTYRGPLVGLGASSTGVTQPLNSYGTTRIQEFRAEARCGTERVTWLSGLVSNIDNGAPNGPEVAERRAELRRQFDAFIDLNVRRNGCVVLSEGGERP